MSPGLMFVPPFVTMNASPCTIFGDRQPAPRSNNPVKAKRIPFPPRGLGEPAPSTLAERRFRRHHLASYRFLFGVQPEQEMSDVPPPYVLLALEDMEIG